MQVLSWASQTWGSCCRRMSSALCQAVAHGRLEWLIHSEEWSMVYCQVAPEGGVLPVLFRCQMSSKDSSAFSNKLVSKDWMKSYREEIRRLDVHHFWETMGSLREMLPAYICWWLTGYHQLDTKKLDCCPQEDGTMKFFLWKKNGGKILALITWVFFRLFSHMVVEVLI